uniref:Uncharacterized protein n=1 Tax=Candidatus Kentrum sp. FW TaxID=2126338 RepID=A0A450T6H3_9GAMM|nr:MAG: hypothetical protein BECKFW1821C_GA0114237_100230 [Candidatus Kentron sp. FW]
MVSIRRRKSGSVADIDKTGTTDKGLQGHDRFQWRRHDHPKAEAGKDIHGKSGELVIGLIEDLIEDHRGIQGNAMLVAA